MICVFYTIKRDALLLSSLNNPCASIDMYKDFPDPDDMDFFPI